MKEMGVIEMIEVKGVRIGDRFRRSRQSRYYKVVDILEKRSLVSGEVVGHICIAKDENLTLATNGFEIPFATVVRNKLK